MAGPIRIAILANGRQAKAEMRGVANQAGLMGKTFSKTAGLVGGVFAVAGLKRAGGAILKVGGDYVSSLNKIQALTDANKKTMDRAARSLEGNAGVYAKMGQTVGDAAGGVVELTKAGVSLKDSLKAVNATMTLAKAGELDVADASTLVANTLNTYSLKAKDAARISNGLANAANISSADVSDLAESLKYVAPIAAKSGVSLDQTNAIMAELANSGVKASQAGTGLRKFLLSLQAPTGKAKEVIDDLGISIYDTSGKMLPFPKIVGNLNGAIGKLSQKKQANVLKTIFGLTGITPAQVILKNGVKGLEEYTKGVQKAGAAQKLANSASKGLQGTIDSLKAKAISTTQALYRQYSPVLNQKIQDLTKWVGENKDEFKDMATSVKNAVLPPLKLLFDIAKTGAKILTSIPEPVRNIGIEAGIAALIMPKLTGAISASTGSLTLNIAKIKQWRAEMSYAETRGAALTRVTGRLGAAAKQAGGVAGMVLLAKGTTSANKGLQSMAQTAAGGALTGFAVGGPVGAGIGFVAGEALGLYQALKSLPGITIKATTTAENYRDALEQTNGALTAQIRNTILLSAQHQGVASLANRMKITQRDLAMAVQGNVGATKRVNAQFAKYSDLLSGPEQSRFQTWLARNTRGLAEQRGEFQRNTNDAKTWNQVLKGLPKKLQTNIKQLGGETSMRVVRTLAHEYKMSPKRLLTRIELAGVNVTGKSLKQIREQIKKTGDADPSNKWLRLFTNDLDVGKTSAKRGGTGIAAALVGPLGKARAKMDPFKASFNSTVDAVKRDASSGGNQIGSNLGSGVSSGVHSWIDNVAGQARAMVQAAIDAAHAQADSHSPSRKTQKLGQFIGDGLVLGMREREAAVREANRRLAAIATTGSSSRRGAEVFRVAGRGSDRHTTERIVERMPSGPVAAHIEGFGEVAMRFTQDVVDGYRSLDRARAGTVYSGAGSD